MGGWLALLLVVVQDGSTDWGVGVVVSFSKRGATRGVPLSEEASSARFVVDMLLWCKPRASMRDAPQPAGAKDKGEVQVVPIMLKLLNGVSSVRIFLPPDIRSKEARASVWKTVSEVKRRFGGPLPLLDPIEDLGVSDSKFSDLVAKAASLQARLVSNPLHSASDKDARFAAYSNKVRRTCGAACRGGAVSLQLLWWACVGEVPAAMLCGC